MQFIHLGRRTGTLSLQRGQDEGEITFHHGAIVGARSPASRTIGELLLEEGILDRAGLDQALRLQAETGARRAPSARSCSPTATCRWTPCATRCAGRSRRPSTSW